MSRGSLDVDKVMMPLMGYAHGSDWNRIYEIVDDLLRRGHDQRARALVRAIANIARSAADGDAA